MFRDSDKYRLGGSVGWNGANSRDDVAKVETLLGQSGHLDVGKTDGPTGYFGRRVEQAVRNYQKDYGLKKDGHINPSGETMTTMKNAQQVFPTKIGQTDSQSSRRETPERDKPLFPAKPKPFSTVPQQPKPKHPPFSELSDEAISSNGRLAKTLNKTTDFTGIKRHLEPGLKARDPKAMAAFNDLREQMNRITPGHGDKLAKAVGAPEGASPPKAKPAAATESLMGDSGNDAFSAKKYMSATDRQNARHGKALEGPPQEFRTLRGTTFFGGAGMEGAYIDDMKKSLEEAGVKNVRIADPKRWSSGDTFMDAVSVPFKNSRDKKPSDLSGFGEKGEQFNLVGYSYGGLQAAQGAIDYADKGGTVDNLVLMGTPIEKGFLKKLQDHPNIRNVRIVDLTEHGDPIKAGMSDAEVLGSVPKLGGQFSSGEYRGGQGHFYYSDETTLGAKRRRNLARLLRGQGLK